jgi:hypothetical protein
VPVQAIILNVHRQDILDEIQAARAELQQAIQGLSPEQMHIVGVTGIWSVKDILAHLTAWESEMVTALNQIHQRKVPRIVRIDDIDEWNAEQYHINASRPLDMVLADFEGVHRMLFKLLEDYDERALTDNRRFAWMEGEPLYYLLEENVYLHEGEHAGEIVEWRQREGI